MWIIKHYIWQNNVNSKGSKHLISNEWALSHQCWVGGYQSACFGASHTPLGKVLQISIFTFLSTKTLLTLLLHSRKGTHATVNKNFKLYSFHHNTKGIFVRKKTNTVTSIHAFFILLVPKPTDWLAAFCSHILMYGISLLKLQLVWSQPMKHWLLKVFCHLQ